jgi:hypothetical protein
MGVEGEMRKRGGESAGTASWIDQELAGCKFADARLGKRFKILVERLSEGVGESIPMACQDWAGTKAAYRFFANERVSEAEILAGHFQATRDRFEATPGTVLVLHDTTEFSFQREKKHAIGSAAILPARVILRLATSSCGEGSPGLPISNWDLARRRLWVIERFVTRLRTL